MIKSVAILILWGVITNPRVQPNLLNADLNSILKLHNQDIAATLHSNANELAELWDDHGVLLGQGDAPIIGKGNLRKSYALEHTKVLGYRSVINDVQITGNTAIEWGTFDAAFSMKNQKKPAKLHARFLRSMKKEVDGSWKFTRIMWQDMNTN